MSVTQRREWGVLVERAVADVLDVDHVDDETAEWHDLRATRDVDVLDVPGSIGVLLEADPGEVKAAAETICRESTPRPGRFHVTRENHEQLLANSGFYALVVYEADDVVVEDGRDAVDAAARALAVLPAETVDVQLESWRDSGHGYEYTQLAWTSLVETTRVRRSDTLKWSPDEEQNRAATTRSESAGDGLSQGKVARTPAGDNP